MLIINQNQWFDVNVLGLILIGVMGMLGCFFTVDILIIVVYEMFLLVFGMYLLKCYQNNKNYKILINNENSWFIQQDNERFAVDLKDYWIQTSRIFIWLKGPNKSVSLMLSRSIIGAELFSQLRTKIT